MGLNVRVDRKNGMKEAHERRGCHRSLSGGGR